jgi:hypothetical protein
MDGDGSFAQGDGHDHLIPRWLNTRSDASRRTLGMDKGRLTGVFGPVENGWYLCKGFRMSAHSSDLSAIA